MYILAWYVYRIQHFVMENAVLVFICLNRNSYFKDNLLSRTKSKKSRNSVQM